MGAYAIIQYLKHTWNAKGRHGTHSPFVYDFIENVLLDPGPIERKYIVEYPRIALRFENIISRTAAYYQYQQIARLPLENGGGPDKIADMLLLEGQPEQWHNLFDNYFSLLTNESAVVIADIHKTKGHTSAWNKLCKDPKVRMSIDLYGIGLLLFREEFKVGQQFILKY